MKLSDFNYTLPESLIAQYPLKSRDQARLMVIDRKQKRITHDIFSNINNYLPKRGTFVLNDSKVIPARILGNRAKTGGRVEIFLLNKLSDGHLYEALLRPLRRLGEGDKIVFNKNGIYAQLLDKERRIVRFNRKNISKLLNQIGHMPLPPYIKRPDKSLDYKYYQTVYAKEPGSVASPTAGLHFTKTLLTKLKKNQHNIERLTLHVNYATFKPVEEQDITRHRMHLEQYFISPKSFDSIKKDKREGRKIIAVGTTSARVLEAVAITKRLEGNTNLFIYPSYQFKMMDALITNFHLPRSTLLMLVCAFATRSLVMRAYKEAIKKKYRFYSYGDGMFIV